MAGPDSTTHAAEQKKSERRAAPKFRVKGTRISFHNDLYPFILRRSWKSFIGLMALAFVVSNLVFTGLYMARPGSIANADGFLEHFFFSIETFATIGYGEMTPQGHYAHTIMSFEAFFGLLTNAMMTGMVFARFARPTAQILFSDKMVIQKWNGVPTLMLRMANQRQNQLAEATVAVAVLITETTLEGHTIRRPTAIKLVREKNFMFALTWTAMHQIEPGSPFYGNDAIEKLKADRSEVFVSLTGLDETLMQTVTARWRYTMDDILPDHRFADVITLTEDERVLDYDQFQVTIPVEKS